MTLHGEYKTPGGKLIAVDFEEANGMLRHVVVTGDFFLYPEEALPLLSAALEGSSAALEEPGYAARVQAALAEKAELLGSSPEALAAAVLRALRSASPGAGDEC